MQSLPIDAIKTTFLAQLIKHHLVVEAETGSGKSTRLPLWAAQQGRVLVIEPRRIACISLAHYLASQKTETTGESVGYAIKLENRYGPQTQVVFVTPGVALRWFAEDQLKSFDVIMIDEFHERRWDTDLLVSMLKESNQHRMIITSATIEGEKLANYIGGTRLQAQGRSYSVSLTHIARDSAHLPSSKNLEKRVCEQVLEELTDAQGDILVFLPGRKEIAQCQSILKNKTSVIVVALHASVDDETRQFALEAQDKQKVVLATNVAETSLTIPNISTVIDSGLERRTVQRNGRTTLILTHISKASAKQRMGRAGRVMNGRCIQLYGQHAALELTTPPEFQRESLVEPMLTASMCGYRLEQLSWLDAIPSKSLDLARSTLLSMEAIDGNGRITEHGEKLYPLPIDAMHADLLTRITKKPLKEAMIDLTAAMSVPSSLYSMNSNRDLLEELNQQEVLGCDANLLIKIVRDEPLSAITLNPDAVKEARGLAEQMRVLFELPMLEVASRYNHQDLAKQIARLNAELIFIRREKRRGALGNGKMEVMPARNSRFFDKSEAAIVLDLHSLPGRGVKQTLNLATVMMPISIADMVEIELGEWRQGDTLIEDDVAYSQMSLVYANRILTTQKTAAIGELASKTILDEVHAERALPGFAQIRSDEIKLWKLYVELGLSEADGHENVTFDSWFSLQLKELELESIQELALFDADDFKFDGIPYWEENEFSQQYPFSLCLGDLNLSASYEVRKKLVTVTYQSGLRKGDPKRWELPRWKGWRVRYQKASRIIDIK
ncbi:DEAD/DEAH box helicase [Vibrio sp. ZSDE26]|uniref:DEAD/DEAH box helicase n=1 Tax=Vibrio amylolyticus TaxID=2847292 RepID=A0A9X1XFI3_9VIBR|nr:helicase-related protein [Vibrio amylolyticus]MCK6261841.1 DEAD/DEAH box helicase [Vibrio amylolyticus]